MEDKHIECSKCGGDMQPGCIMSPIRSAVGLVMQPNLAEWYAGQAGAGFLGYNLPAESYPVTVYRCKRCGYLECYAN